MFHLLGGKCSIYSAKAESPKRLCRNPWSLKKNNYLETATRKRGKCLQMSWRGLGALGSQVAHTPDVQWNVGKPHLLPRSLALEWKAAEPCQHTGNAEELTPWGCALSQWLQRLAGSSRWGFHGATGVCLLWDSSNVLIQGRTFRKIKLVVHVSTRNLNSSLGKKKTVE